MGKSEQYIRFDWAVKRLLRNKANFDVLEGFMTVLIGEEIRIIEILESEGNQMTEDDKFNRVDIKARNSKGEIIIVEIQNTRDYQFLERILYGVSKAITEHISIGNNYGNIKKVYSISILYFDIGEGSDYIYHGRNEFIGVNTHDRLLMNRQNLSTISQRLPSEVFPEYFLIRVNEFDKVAVSPLEEWMKYLKDGVINSDTKTPGLKEAQQKLQYYDMSQEERNAYEIDLKNRRIKWAELDAAKFDGRIEGREEGIVIGEEKGIEIGKEKGIEIGKEEGKTEKQLEIARNLKALAIPCDAICKATGLSFEDIERC